MLIEDNSKENKQEEKAKKTWLLMINNPENSHNLVRRGGRGGKAPFCSFLTQMILDNENEFFGKMLQKKLTHKEVKKKGNYKRFGYFKSDHGSKENRAIISNRKEDLNSIRLYEDYPDIVIDRQTPLMDGSKTNPDLLIYYDGVLFFGEAKKDDSSEPLLRAVIEIERYFHFVDHEQLINDFKTASPRLKDKKITCCKVQKAIIIPNYVFKSNNQGRRTFSLIDQLTCPEYRNVQELIKKRHIFIMDAQALNNGKVSFVEGFSPSDYGYVK